MLKPIDLFFDALKVYDVPGFTKVRVGRKCDGGYVVLDKLCSGSTVYAYGIGDDVSFEEDFVQRYNGKARCFDHTVDGIPSTDSRISFQKTGLGTGEPHLHLVHEDFTVDDNLTPKLLKIDVEYNEWDYLTKWFYHTGAFHQIIIELHILPVRTFHPPVPYKVGEQKYTDGTKHDMIQYAGCSPYFQRMYADFDDRMNRDLFTTY
jgi:hypothetical protein